MFLDFIHSDDRKNKIQYSSSLVIRMPQVIVLIGEYTWQELEHLQDNLKKHFPDETKIFWICTGDEEISMGSVHRITCCADSGEYLEKRHEYAQTAEKAEVCELAEASVADIFNATSGVYYQASGSIQISILVKAEQTQSGLMEPMAKLLKNYFAEQFSRVYEDLYILADQSVYRERKTEKEAAVYLTLTEAEEMIRARVVDKAYVLSNIDDKQAFLNPDQTREEWYASIALMIMLKGVVPENSAYRYSDKMFEDKVQGLAQQKVLEPGLLSSLGYMKLQSDRTYARMVSYYSVWKMLGGQDENFDIEEAKNQLGITKIKLKQQAQGMFREMALSQENFDAIVRNHTLNESVIYTMKNGDAVNKFFGNNLSLYCELNLSSRNTEHELNTWHEGLKQKIHELSRKNKMFDIAYLLKQLEEDIQQLIDEEAGIVKGKERKLSEWEAAVFAKSKSASNRNQSPVYLLAEAYIRLRNDLRKSYQQKEFLADMKRKARDLSTYYNKYKKIVTETCESLEQEIKRRQISAEQAGNGILRVQIANAENYYAEVTEQILDKGENGQFAVLKNNLKDMILSGKIEETEMFRAVQAYCEKNIFSRPIFTNDFLQELRCRLIGYEDENRWKIETEADVSNFLLGKIIDGRHTLFYDRISQGNDTHEEMCLFLQDESIFDGESDRNAHLANILRSETLKLFCDKHSSCMDIIFIAGNLKANVWYKWENYKTSYEKIVGTN